MICVLRVRFPGAQQLVRFVQDCPASVRVKAWADALFPPAGRRHPDAFNVDLGSDEERWSDLLRGVLQDLESQRELIRDARDHGASMEIDFALEVGDPSIWMTSAVFSGEELSRLSELGVRLRVSAYYAFGGAA